jgi:hypothetical protein
MKLGLFSGVLFSLGLSVLMPAAALADEAADKKAAMEKRLEDAKKKAEEKRKAAADKATADKAAADKAAADKAAADKAAADKAAADKAAADKAAADKAAADKAAADKAAAGGATGAGGTTGASGAASGGAGGVGGKSASGGAGGAAAKADLKDPPLPAGDIETLRKDRSERRKLTVERLRRRWGNVLADPKGAADLKQHSRRVAFLQRIRVVADAKKDKKAIETVDELLTQEDQRHGSAMNALREGALSVGTSK